MIYLLFFQSSESSIPLLYYKKGLFPAGWFIKKLAVLISLKSCLPDRKLDQL